MKVSSGGLPYVAVAGFFAVSLNLMICEGGGFLKFLRILKKVSIMKAIKFLYWNYVAVVFPK